MVFKSNKAHKYDITNDPLFLEYVHYRHLKPEAIRSYTRKLIIYSKITGMTLTDLIEEAERDEDTGIRKILSEIVDPNRVTIRDRKYYCGVLLDDNQKKILCRMRFNSKQEKLGFFDSQERNESGVRKEDKISIEDLSEIYKYAERLKKYCEILYWRLINIHQILSDILDD